MTSSTEAIPLCRRCGTLLRRARLACPSCGAVTRPAEPAPAPAAPVVNLAAVRALTAPSPKSAGLPPRATPAAAPPETSLTAKPVLKMCALCYGSTPEADLMDYEGRKVCPECHRGLLRKANRT